MEPELYAMSPPGVSWHTSRLHLPKVTVSEIEHMMEAPELEAAFRLLARAPLDAICFGGTSPSFLHGKGWDLALLEAIRCWAPGIPVTTASTAVLAALDAVGAGPIAMATPYTDDINRLAVRFLSDNGHQVLSYKGLGITGDHKLAEVSLDTVYQLAVDTDVAKASAMFLSCTNVRTIGCIQALEERLDKPVISAVQASGWHAMRLAGIRESLTGYGSLLERPIPTQPKNA
jgi:maleate isomerase